jgi:hypothetical protein
MAEDYQSEAVKLDSDKSPDIGEPPARIEGVPIGIGSITTYQFQSSSGLSSARCCSGTCHGDCLDCRRSRTNSDAGAVTCSCPRPAVYPADVLTLETLADVRALVEKHLPAEYRSKFIWRQLAGLL